MLRQVAIAVAATILTAASARADDVVELRPEPVPPDGVFRWFGDWRPHSPRWAVALGGGGSWGIAHIGLLEALEEDGLRPDVVAGTSIGALVGSFVASGISPHDVERSFRATDWNTVLTRHARPPGSSEPDDPLYGKNALVRFGRTRNHEPLLFRGIVPDGALSVELVRYLSWASAACGGNLDRLPIPFRAVTTDLRSGERFAPSAGNLPALVRGSLGLPLFRPIEIDGRLLVDGGALENVPVLTAREAGAEAVVAVQLTADGRDLPLPPPVSSLQAQVARTYDVAAAAQRRADLDAADVKINVAAGGISFVDFHGNLDASIEAGREAWAASREEVLRRLERDSPRYDVRRVEAGTGVEPIMAAEMAVRLGVDGGARSISAFRLELELVRILRIGGYDDGLVRVHPDGTVEVALGRGAVVRSLAIDAPPSLAPDLAGISLDRLPSPVLPRTAMAAIDAAVLRARERGLFLCSVRDVRWDPTTGDLRVVLDEGRLDRLEAVSTSSGETVASVAGGGPATLRDLQSLFVRLEHRRLAESVGGIDLRSEGDGFGVTLRVEEPPMWEMTLQPGLSDALGPTLWARFSLPSLAGWDHWDLDARITAWRLGTLVAAEVSPPSRTWFARGIAARTRLPDYGPHGELRGSRGFGLQAAGIGARTPRGRWGRAEALVAFRTVLDDAFAGIPGVGAGRDPVENPDDLSIDYSLDLAWSADRRDDPARPKSGLAWSLAAIVPFAGAERAAVATADVSLHVPFGRARRISAALLVHAAQAQVEKPLPLDRWSDVGSWSDAPAMLPGRGLSPEVRRGTFALRGDVAEISGASIVAGASVAAWRTGEVRADPSLPRGGHGVALFAEVYYGRFGPVVLGFAKGSVEGNALYVLARPFQAPWPGPRLALPGR